MYALILGAITVAFLHSFAPDHWVPLVAIARGSSWSMKRLAIVAAAAGICHVVVSTALALCAVWLGMQMEMLSGINTVRGNAAVWVLITFGVVYTLWGIYGAFHSKPSSTALTSKTAVQQYARRRVLVLLLIMVIGPAEPIVPLLLVAHTMGTIALWIVGIAFTVTLSSMIVVQCCLAYAGIRRIQSDWLERHIHTMSGIAVLMTGIMLLFI